MAINPNPPSQSTPKPTRPARTVLPEQTGRLEDHYSLVEEIGRGQSSVVYLCFHKSTQERYACKSIPKSKLFFREDFEEVRREIQIMRHLSEHPNVARINNVYEDGTSVHIVMEHCGGGELFDRIHQKGRFGEREAAKVIKVIVAVVEACHSHGVMHRDLKPENFVFDSPDDDAKLKMIDFGLSVFFKPGEVFNDVVGSPYYVAPEVMLKHYGPEVDVWSAGVILYILLSGVPPFWGETQSDIFREILQGQLDLESDLWTSISDGAKDLIKKMLEIDTGKRLSAREVLCHPWIVDDEVAPDIPSHSLTSGHPWIVDDEVVPDIPLVPSHPRIVDDGVAPDTSLV